MGAKSFLFERKRKFRSYCYIKNQICLANVNKLK